MVDCFDVLSVGPVVPTQSTRRLQPCNQRTAFKMRFFSSLWFSGAYSRFFLKHINITSPLAQGFIPPFQAEATSSIDTFIMRRLDYLMVLNCSTLFDQF